MHARELDETEAGSPGPIRAVFLDRDGVINVKQPEGAYVTRPETLRLCDGAAAAIARLQGHGFRVFVVTNQRGIAQGLFTEEDLRAVHAAMERLLAERGAHLDGIYVCPHAKDSCECRKPLPGLLLRALGEFPEITAGESLMVGDALSDILAGQAAGMRTVFVEGDEQTRPPGAAEAAALATWRAGSLWAFVARYF